MTESALLDNSAVTPLPLPTVTPMQKRFALRYSAHLDQGRAAREAGYKINKSNAREVGDDALARPRVKAWVNHYMAEITKNAVEIDGPRIRLELQKKAITDVGSFFECVEVPVLDSKGDPILLPNGDTHMEKRFVAKDFTEMDTAGIKSVKLVENKYGQQVQLEVFNQQEALIKLGQTKGEFMEDGPRPQSVTFKFVMEQPTKVRQIIEIEPDEGDIQR